MKTSGRCPSCAGNVIYRVATVGDAGDWVGEGQGPIAERTGTHLAPRRILMAKSQGRGIFGGMTEHQDPTGETEAYICGACGRVEEYLKGPERIDWTTVVGASPWTPPTERR